MACRLLRVSELELVARAMSASIQRFYFKKITPN
jgi:hypothetical protein